MLKNMGMTTIKITSELRDRIASVTTDYGGVTLAGTLERLVEEHEERALLAAFDRLRADDAEWASYKDESRLTDNVAADWLHKE
jgi:hypothetical protein